MARDLRDKVIAITGGSSGIGAAVAVECAKSGMHVALGARRLDQLEEVARMVREHGVRALVVRCDVNQDGEVAQFRLMPPDEVLARLHAHEFTTEAALILAQAGL